MGKRKLTKEELLELWERYSKALDVDDYNDATIETINQLGEELESVLPFKNEKQHEHWLDVATSYKFWEDYEELTLEIINQANSVNKKVYKYWCFLIRPTNEYNFGTEHKHIVKALNYDNALKQVKDYCAECWVQYYDDRKVYQICYGEITFMYQCDASGKPLGKGE